MLNKNIRIIIMLAFATILCSCTTEKKRERNVENRIVYKINKKVVDTIYTKFKKVFDNEENVVVFMDCFVRGDIKTLSVSRYTDDYTELINKTNRFLKINDSIYAPVLFRIDTDYYTRKDENLLRSAGGRVGFVLNEKDSITMITIEMQLIQYI